MEVVLLLSAERDFKRRTTGLKTTVEGETVLTLSKLAVHDLLASREHDTKKIDISVTKIPYRIT